MQGHNKEYKHRVEKLLTLLDIQSAHNDTLRAYATRLAKFGNIFSL